MKTKLMILLATFLFMGMAQTGGDEKKDKKEQPITFNGLKLERFVNPRAPQDETYKDTSGTIYIKLLLKVTGVQLENVTGEVFFTERDSPAGGSGLIPFKNLTVDELEAVLAEIKYLQAKKKLKD